MSVATILRKNDWPEIKAFLKESSPDILDFWDIGTADEMDDYEKCIGEEKLSISESTRIGEYSEFLFGLSLCRNIERHKDKALSSLLRTIELVCMRKMRCSERIIHKALEIKGMLTSYVNGTETAFSSLVYASHFSSTIDTSAYIGVPNLEDILFEEVPLRIQNVLSAMVAIFEKIFVVSGLIKPDSVVLYHPTFEPWGTYLGGAEADLYIDGCLYEIKSGKREKNRWTDIGQVYAYYLLNKICESTKEETTGCDLSKQFNIGCTVNEIALYYSRTGVLKNCPIEILNYYRKKKDEDVLRSIIATKVNKGLKERYEKELNFCANMILRRRYGEIQSGKREINQHRKELERPFAVGERIYLPREGWGNIMQIFQSEKGLAAIVSMDNGNEWKIAFEKVEVLCIDDSELVSLVPKPCYLPE